MTPYRPIIPHASAGAKRLLGVSSLSLATLASPAFADTAHEHATPAANTATPPPLSGPDRARMRRHRTDVPSALFSAVCRRRHLAGRLCHAQPGDDRSLPGPGNAGGGKRSPS